ncbi:hypothetical protein ACY4M0_002389, partial [Acinetobacter baumannii]
KPKVESKKQAKESFKGLSLENKGINIVATIVTTKAVMICFQLSIISLFKAIGLKFILILGKY